MPEIVALIKSFPFDQEFDMVLAIARGGIIPGVMLAQSLSLPLELLWLNLRDDAHNMISDDARLIRSFDVSVAGKRILLVDDRVKTGRTFLKAKTLLSQAALVKTFAVNGKADYSLFDEVCFPFPWTI